MTQMDKGDFFVITINVAIVMVLQSYEHIYIKKLRHEHHNENFKESILRDKHRLGYRLRRTLGLM